MDAREIIWHNERCGKCTSSKLSDLLTKGTKGIQWGKTSLTYLYSKRKELRTGIPAYHADNKNFRDGRMNEPLAIACLRENTMYDIKHCSVDYPQIRVTSGGIDDFLDSLDFIADDIFLGEIKCVETDEKFEYISCCTKADVIDEYKEQMAGHFLGNPGFDKLMYVVYRGRVEDYELDTIDEMDASRLKIFIFDRADFGELISSIEPRIKEGMAAVRQSLETGEKLESILNG